MAKIFIVMAFFLMVAKYGFAFGCPLYDIHIDNYTTDHKLYFIKLIKVEDEIMRTVGSRSGEMKINKDFMFYLYHNDGKIFVEIKIGEDYIFEKFEINNDEEHNKQSE